MALRNIVTKEDKILYKVCRPVVKFNERLHQLLDDMADTLSDAGGVGLAAPQVGVLRRAVLVLETNVEEDEEEFIIELINPEILEASGEQVGAQDRFGEWFEYEGDGLTARCILHECDHLDGHLFLEKCERMLTEEEINGPAEEE